MKSNLVTAKTYNLPVSSGWATVQFVKMERLMDSAIRR